MKVKHVVLGMTLSLAVIAVAALIIAVGFAMLGMNGPAILAGVFALVAAYLAYRVARKREEIEAIARGALAVLLIGAVAGYVAAAPVAHAEETTTTTGGMICGGVVDLACRALKLIDIGSFFASIGLVALVFFMAMLFAVAGQSAFGVLIEIFSMGAGRAAPAALLVVMFLGLFLMAALFGISKVCVEQQTSVFGGTHYCIPSDAPEAAMQSTILGRVLYNYAKVFFDQIFSQLTGSTS